MKVVFFGSSKFVIPILEVLQKNFDLKLVLTTEKNPTDAVPNYCKANNIEFLSVSNLSDPIINSKLLTINSPLAVLADFGLIIPKEILQIFPKGIINIHPSLLPKYRGPTPVQTAILNGDKTTGVTIIKLDEEIDHGPILAQTKEQILEDDTAESLYERLFEKGATLLLKILNKYLDGSLKLILQNHAKATFTNPLTRQDGYLNLSNVATAVTTKDTDRMIRAYFPWPGTWTKLRLANRDVRIKFLPNNKLQVEGKKPVSYKDFINGYPNAKSVILQILQKL